MIKRYDSRFNKYNRIVQRIEMLSELVKKEPENESYKKQLKKAEDGLCRMIQEEEKEIERYLETLNEEDTWEE